MRIRDCTTCNGTGIDPVDFTGRCFACDGRGDVEDLADFDMSDDDEDPQWNRQEAIAEMMSEP